jgi:hypothetical protein
MTNKAKKLRRDIQDRTGWTYGFCHYLVSSLGYEEVSKAIDDAPETHGALEELGRVLNKRANDAAKECG